MKKILLVTSLLLCVFILKGQTREYYQDENGVTYKREPLFQNSNQRFTNEQLDRLVAGDSVVIIDTIYKERLPSSLWFKVDAYQQKKVFWLNKKTLFLGSKKLQEPKFLGQKFITFFTTSLSLALFLVAIISTIYALYLVFTRKANGRYLNLILFLNMFLILAFSVVPNLVVMKMSVGFPARLLLLTGACALIAYLIARVKKQKEKDKEAVKIIIGPH